MNKAEIQEQSYALYNKGWKLIFVDMKEAVKWIKQAHELSVSIDDPVGTAKYNINMAIVNYVHHGNLKLAIQLGLEALKFFKEQADESYLADLCQCYFLLGKVYWDLGSRDRGIDYLTTAHDMARSNRFTEMEGRALGFLANSYYDVKDYELALSYFQQSLEIYEHLPVESMAVRFTITLGCTYKETGDFAKSIQYLKKGIELCQSIGNQMLLGKALNDLANTYFAMKESERAIQFFEESLTLRKQTQQPQGVITTLLDMAFFYIEFGNDDQAETNANEALAIAQSLNFKPKVQRAYELLSLICEKRNDMAQAFHYFKAYHQIKSEIDQSSAEAKLNNIRLGHQAEQAEREFQLALAQNQILADMNDQLEKTNLSLDREKMKSESLLLNILPEPIAERLKNGETLIADSFPEVTVLFADIVGFTQLSAALAPDRLVQFLNRIFRLFDELAARYQLEKIKTIGDAYMVVSGIPLSSAAQTERMADMALDMLAAIQALSAEMSHSIGIRIGIHSGAAVAGVIGSSKFAYDIWGDTVNMASRMESSGESGAIHVTEAVYHRLQDQYTFRPRGLVDIKGKGEISTYFLVEKA